MGVAIIIAILLGGGLSVTAENAVPGGALYPIKTGVNENVRGALAFSTESKANWNVSQANRRLEETTEMSLKGKFDAEAQTIILDKLTVHVEKAEERIKKLETEGNITAAVIASSNLESSLRGHQEILLSIYQNGTAETQSNLAPIVAAVNSRTDNATTLRSQVELALDGESGAGLETAIIARVQSTDRLLKDVQSLLEKESGNLSNETKASVGSKISLASSLSLSAQSSAQSGANAETFKLLNQAHRFANEARVLIETRKNIDAKSNTTANTNQDRETESEATSESSASTSVKVETNTKTETNSGSTEASGSLELNTGLGI